MQEHYFDLLRQAVSHERMETYCCNEDDEDLDLFARYVWNIQLSEALYPVLQNVEVVLRNSVHTAAAKAFNNKLWLDCNPNILKEKEQSCVEKAKKDLRKRGKQIEPGRLVAELNFGFWTSLFDVRYEQVLWPKLLKTAFPYMPRRILTRKTLSKQLNQVRHLRNRVFHHEPIWYLDNLLQQHHELLEVIGWINPALQQTVQSIDRFASVYHDGYLPCRTRLDTFWKGSRL